MVERAVSQYEPKASEKDISLAVKNTRGSGVFDPKWTEEALCNLLDNAVKYTPCGGSVTVEVREYEMFSAIQVTDTGPGIPEEEQAKIFGRFYRSPLRLAGGRRGNRPVSDPPDRFRPGRICEGEKRTGKRQHLFAVSSAVRDKTVHLLRTMFGTKNDNSVTFLTVPGKISMIKSVV